MEHILSGALTGNINYVFPASAGRIVRIVNNTTGAFTVTVKQSGGTGCVAPQGEKNFLVLSANTTTATPLLTNLGNSPSIGAPAGTTGSLRLYNANNTNITTIQSGTSTAPWTLTLPINAGAANQFLQTDGTGNASWGTSSVTLSAVANNNVVANISGGTAVPAGTSVTAVLDSALGTGVAGLAFRGTSTWSSLAHGTGTVQFLQSGGTNVPTWGTVAMTDPGSTQATTGLQKFPGGNIVQWGLATGGTCTFGTAFPNNCFNVVTVLASNIGSGDTTYLSVTSKSTTTFVVAASAARYYQAWGN